MAHKPSHSNTSSGTRNTTEARGRKTARSGRLNSRKYAELLSGTLPRIIEDDAELERIAQRVEPCSIKARAGHAKRKRFVACCSN